MEMKKQDVIQVEDERNEEDQGRVSLKKAYLLSLSYTLPPLYRDGQLVVHV